MLQYIGALKVNRIWSEKGELPCQVLYVSHELAFEIPTQPVDRGLKVGDAIYRNPRQVNLTLRVYYRDINKFKQMIELGQKSQSGFKVRTLSGTQGNLRIVSAPIEESPEDADGYSCNMVLRELILATSKSAKITARARRGSNTSTKKSGKKEPDKTLLASGIDAVFG